MPIVKQDAIDILIVEDNPQDAELTIREITRNQVNARLMHVKDGKQALDLLSGSGPPNLPKLILLDLKMPKVSGIEALQKIKADQRTHKIPVVILTSSRQDPDIQLCYDLGANSYIVKPVNFEDFATAIKNIGYYWFLLNQPPA